MKDQQRAPQEQKSQSRETRQEQHSVTEHLAAKMPAAQWAQILRRGEGLTRLPEQMLEHLAKSVGNSSLTVLLRGGSDDGPRTYTYTPETPTPERLETPVNHINTAPPRLFPFAGWQGQGAPRTRSVKPGGIRSRG